MHRERRAAKRSRTRGCCSSSSCCWRRRRGGRPGGRPRGGQGLLDHRRRVDARCCPTATCASRTRTLDFTGTFHYVYWDLSTEGSEGIVDPRRRRAVRRRPRDDGPVRLPGTPRRMQRRGRHVRRRPGAPRARAARLRPHRHHGRFTVDYVAGRRQEFTTRRAVLAVHRRRDRRESGDVQRHRAPARRA